MITWAKIIIWANTIIWITGEHFNAANTLTLGYRNIQANTIIRADTITYMWTYFQSFSL